MPTVWPSLSTPLPSTATACGTGDGLSIVIVTFPALALSDALSNLSWPLSSAASWRLLEAPPLLAEGVVGGFWAVVSLAVVSLVAPPLSLLELSSLPQPATARAATAAQSAADGTIGFIWRASPGRCERVACLFLRRA